GSVDWADGTASAVPPPVPAPPAMRLFAALPLLLLVLAAGCGTPRPVTGGVGSSSRTPAPEMADVTVGETFSMERGSSVELDGRRLRFDAVYEDSRCPEGTTCVWEGRAVVGLTLAADNQIREVRLEIPGFVDEEDAPQPSQRTEHGGYTFTIL